MERLDKLGEGETPLGSAETKWQNFQGGRGGVHIVLAKGNFG